MLRIWHELNLHLSKIGSPYLIISPTSANSNLIWVQPIRTFRRSFKFLPWEFQRMWWQAFFSLLDAIIKSTWENILFKNQKLQPQLAGYISIIFVGIESRNTEQKPSSAREKKKIQWCTHLLFWRQRKDDTSRPKIWKFYRARSRIDQLPKIPPLFRPNC